MAGSETGILQEARRRHRDMRRALGADLRGMREDCGATLTSIAAAAGIDRAHLYRIELGEVDASLGVLVAVSTALGARLSLKAYPDSGPRIRDRHQAAMIDALLRSLDPRWRRLPEVAVHRPARGYIDAVLADLDEPSGAIIVATEAQSELRRLDQLIRWSLDKAESLPSADAWRFLAAADRPEPTVSRLLLIRSTAATRDVATRFAHVLATAYPALPADLLRSLTTPEAPWPGAGILWARVENGSATILDRPPRGVILTSRPT